MIDFVKNIPMSGAIAACSMLISLLALFYARNNMKMQKYIDVVTTQRLKWISELRNDFSDILSFLYSSTYVKELADHWDMMKDEVDDWDDESYHTVLDNIRKLRNMGSYESTSENIAQFIRKIELCKMKLNGNDPEDKLLIEKLEELKTIPFGDYLAGKLNPTLKDVRSMMSKILKNEWERAKLEVQKGGIVSGKRKNIFD